MLKKSSTTLRTKCGSLGKAAYNLWA